MILVVVGVNRGLNIENEVIIGSEVLNRLFIFRMRELVYLINMVFIFLIILFGILNWSKLFLFSFLVVFLKWLIGFSDVCSFFRVVFVEFR